MLFLCSVNIFIRRGWVKWSHLENSSSQAYSNLLRAHMDGLKKKDKKSKSKKTKATQWAIDSYTWPWVPELACTVWGEWGKAFVCYRNWISFRSPDASESPFIHMMTCVDRCHFLCGNVSSLAVQCHWWTGTQTEVCSLQDEATQPSFFFFFFNFNSHHFCIGTRSKTAPETDPWNAMISCHLSYLINHIYVTFHS